MRLSGDDSAVSSCLSNLASGRTGGRAPAAPSHAWIREHLEVLVVALGLAFGIRALFLQPFKIPTGSMQPTLYGIHFVEQETPPPKGFLQRFFAYVNYSRRGVDVVVEESGAVDLSRLTALPSMPFFPTSSVPIGSRQYVVSALRTPCCGRCMTNTPASAIQASLPAKKFFCAATWSLATICS